MPEVELDIGEIEKQIKYAESLGDAEVDRLYNLVEEVKTDQNMNPYYYFRPLPTQKKFCDWPGKNKWLLGGNRSGKTTTGVHFCISEMLKYPNTHWWAGSETWEVSRIVQQERFHSLLPRDQIDFGVYNAHTGFRHNIIRLKNGSTVRFRSYDQERERWQGADLDGVLLDEEPPWDIYQECLARVMKSNGWVIGTMTALSGYTRMVDYLMSSSSKNVKIFFISTYENVREKGGALTRESIDKMIEQSDDKTSMESRISGIPTVKTGLVFGTYRDEIPYVVPYKDEPGPSKSAPTLISIDPHPSIPHCFLVIQISQNGHVNVVKERPWLIKENSMEKAPWVDMDGFSREVSRATAGLIIENSLIDKHACHQGNAVTGTSIQQELMKRGIYTTEAGGHVESKVLITQQFFMSKRIHIFESCWNLRWELKRYIWEPHISSKTADRREDKQTPRKKNDHLIDCLMNALLYIHESDMVRVSASPIISKIVRNPAGKEMLDRKDLFRQPIQEEQNLVEMYS
jgi:phage terminase large subunit-like protein